MFSVLRFIPIGVFDDATVRTIGRAFDAACKELKDTGQPDVVHEVMIKRIISAARKDERNVTRLRDAALTGLRKPRKRNSWIKVRRLAELFGKKVPWRHPVGHAQARGRLAGLDPTCPAMTQRRP